jgi:hypothetical protein
MQKALPPVSDNAPAWGGFRRPPKRAIVFPDDTITVEAETPSQWARDSGHNDDTYQGHARWHWRMNDMSWTEPEE